MTAKPYHILDGGKVRCHVCGALLRWVDAIETETDDAEAAEAVFDFPGTTAQLNSRMDTLEERMDRLMSITEKIETVAERLASAVASLAEMRAHDVNANLEHHSEVMFV